MTKRDLMELGRIPPKKPISLCSDPSLGRKRGIGPSFGCNPVGSLIGTFQGFNLVRSSRGSALQKARALSLCERKTDVKY